MQLKHIKTETCPTCGAEAVYEERDTSYHVNGTRGESRQFACGLKLQVGDVVTFRTPVTTYEGPKSTGVVQSTKPVVMSLDGRFYRFSEAQLSCPEEYSVSRAGKMIHQSGSKSDNPEISESFS